MDYRGQKLSEYIYSILTILFGAIAWLIGYYKQDFSIAFHGWAVGLIISLLLCIPDWPMFNRNAVVWLEEIGKSNSSKAAGKVTDKVKVKKSKKA